MQRLKGFLVYGLWFMVRILGAGLFVFAMNYELFTMNHALAYADLIYFKSGETMKGLVVEEHRDRVVVNTEEGEKAVFRWEIDEVFYDDPERNYLYLGNQALESGDLQLAYGLFKKALQIHPRFEEASDALNRLEERKLKLSSPSEVSDPLAALEERWGLQLEPAEERARVASVRPGSLAGRSGIRPGDTLISLWGESLAYLPLKEVAEILLGPPGSMAKLTIQRSLALPKAVSRGSRWPGMRLSMERWGLTVLELEPRSVAASHDVRRLDRIVRIGESHTRYMPLVQAIRLIHGKRDEGVTFLVHRELKIQRE